MEANKQIELTSSELKELLTMGGDDDTDDEEDVGFGGTEKTVAVNAEQLLKDLEEKEKIEDEDDQDIERIRLYQEQKKADKIAEENQKATPRPRVTTGQDEENKRRIKITPPGLKLLQDDAFLQIFTYKDLNLEGDFEYQKRSKLEKLGFRKEIIDEMLGDPVNFAAYLAPESCSSLIGNEADFVNICDYIFYFCTSCYDDFLFELYSKTLYELLKNYSYRWKLRLKHIMTALKNLGFREDAMLCKKHFDDCLANRIEVIQQYCKAQGKAYKFALPSYPTFFKKRLERAPIETNDEETSPPSQEDRLKCVKNFISLVSNIVVTHSQLTEFKVSSGHDWTSQLILIHIFVLLSSDKLLNSDSFVKNNISLMLYQQFNSFSYKQWFGKEDPNSKGDKSKPKQNDFHSDEANASLDISEIISQVGQYDGVKNAFTWDRDSIAPLDHLGTMDHHHNMLQRVQLLPPTFRGNMIKKNAAYLQLQLLMDVDMESATSTDIEDLFKLLKEPSNKIKFRTLYMDVYTMYSVIQLIDIITGSEPIDFTPEKAGIISDMKELLNSFAAKYLQNKNGLNPDQPMLYEILVQKTTKWDIKLKRHPRHDTIFSSSLTAQQSDSDEDM